MTRWPSLSLTVAVMLVTSMPDWNGRFVGDRRLLRAREAMAATKPKTGRHARTAHAIIPAPGYPLSDQDLL